jgi:glutathione S-transferase
MHPVEVPALLSTVPHSRYAEKARWGLDRLAIAYREEPHVPLLQRVATKRQGGGSVPVLVRGVERFVDSKAILRLGMPTQATAGGRCIREPDFRGPHTRRWAHFQYCCRIGPCFTR